MRNNWWVGTIVVVVAVLGLIYVGGFGTLKNRKAADNPPEAGRPLKTIVAKRTFANGRHTITGVIDLPSPCHGLSIDTTVTESYPEQVALNFYSTTTSETCAQVETPVQFKEEFQASGYAVIRAYWNGELARLQFTD